MFTQLALEDLSDIALLFDYSRRLRMVICSILAGNSPACVYRAAGGDLYLLWDQGNNLFYAAGVDPLPGLGPALSYLLKESIIPRFAARGEEHFSVDLPNSPAIRRELRTGFSPYLQREREKLFFSHPGSPGRPGGSHDTDGVDFMPVDGKMLCGEGPANWEVVRSEILCMWPSVERFLACGWGTAAVLQGRIVGWCTAEYVGPEKVGIGIETEPDMRRRGVATGAGAVFLQQCGQYRRRPHWECDAANEPSIRLAGRLGFRLVERRTVVSGLFPAPGEG